MHIGNRESSQKDSKKNSTHIDTIILLYLHKSIAINKVYNIWGRKRGWRQKTKNKSRTIYSTSHQRKLSQVNWDLDQCYPVTYVSFCFEINKQTSQLPKINLNEPLDCSVSEPLDIIFNSKQRCPMVYSSLHKWEWSLSIFLQTLMSHCNLRQTQPHWRPHRKKYRRIEQLLSATYMKTQ